MSITLSAEIIQQDLNLLKPFSVGDGLHPLSNYLIFYKNRLICCGRNNSFCIIPTTLNFEGEVFGVPSVPFISTIMALYGDIIFDQSNGKLLCYTKGERTKINFLKRPLVDFTNLLEKLLEKSDKQISYPFSAIKFLAKFALKPGSNARKNEVREYVSLHKGMAYGNGVIAWVEKKVNEIESKNISLIESWLIDKISYQDSVDIISLETSNAFIKLYYGNITCILPQTYLQFPELDIQTILGKDNVTSTNLKLTVDEKNLLEACGGGDIELVIKETGEIEFFFQTSLYQGKGTLSCDTSLGGGRCKVSGGLFLKAIEESCTKLSLMKEGFISLTTQDNSYGVILQGSVI